MLRAPRVVARGKVPRERFDKITVGDRRTRADAKACLFATRVKRKGGGVARWDLAGARNRGKRSGRVNEDSHSHPA